MSVNRFLIGQYGSFDEGKYARDFRRGFYGIEACLFSDERDVAKLRNEAEHNGFRIGVHFPLRAGRHPLRDALFLAQDDRVRQEAYEAALQELEYLRAIRPSYVLFHYPKPVLLDEQVDWSEWRFDDRSEYEWESGYSCEEFSEKSGALFEWLSEKGEQYGFTPVLEFDGLNRYVTQTDLIARLLDRYSNVKVCLDTARLYLQDRLDPHFDAKKVIATYAKYAELIHLSNMQIDGSNRVVQKRQPVRPSLKPEDGWAPIADYIGIISRQNDKVKIMFEHRSDRVTDEELAECYDWVDVLLQTQTE